MASPGVGSVGVGRAVTVAALLVGVGRAVPVGAARVGSPLRDGKEGVDGGDAAGLADPAAFSDGVAEAPHDAVTSVATSR